MHFCLPACASAVTLKQPGLPACPRRRIRVTQGKAAPATTPWSKAATSDQQTCKRQAEPLGWAQTRLTRPQLTWRNHEQEEMIVVFEATEIWAGLFHRNYWYTVLHLEMQRRFSISKSINIIYYISKFKKRTGWLMVSKKASKSTDKIQLHS